MFESKFLELTQTIDFIVWIAKSCLPHLNEFALVKGLCKIAFLQRFVWRINKIKYKQKFLLWSSMFRELVSAFMQIEEIFLPEKTFTSFFESF